MSTPSTNAALPNARQQLYRRTPHVIGTTAGDSTVLLDVERGVYYTLNEVGGRVWALLQDETTFADIVEWLLNEYDVPAAVVDADVATLLDSLVTAQLVEPGTRC